MMSPTCNWAFSAGVPLVMPLIRAPTGKGSPASAAVAGPKLASRVTPRNARLTSPRSINWRPMIMNMLIGIAKPMPSSCPELLAIAELMPITSPRRLTNGPPLLPGLIEASV